MPSEKIRPQFTGSKSAHTSVLLRLSGCVLDSNSFTTKRPSEKYSQTAFSISKRCGVK